MSRWANFFFTITGEMPENRAKMIIFAPITGAPEHTAQYGTPHTAYIRQQQKRNIQNNYGTRRRFQENRFTLQGIRFCVPFQRHLRRTRCRLRLRSERCGVEEQYQAILVAGHDSAPREHRRHRQRHLHASHHLEGQRTRRRLQRPPHRQPRQQKALPRRRPYRRPDCQIRRED